MTLVERLRTALATGGARGTEMLTGDSVDPDLQQPVPVAAAVLIAITERAEPGVLLTRRTTGLRHHAGQVAFPGGRIDADDAGPIDAALREAEEEIGLPRGVPQVIGAVDRYRTITGYDVTPVVAVIPPDLVLVPQESEVAAVFEVPLDFLLAPANHRLRAAEWQGRMRRYHEMIWDGHRIWGATAAMIVNLSRRLQP